MGERGRAIPSSGILRLIRHGREAGDRGGERPRLRRRPGLVAAADIAIAADWRVLSFSEVRIGAIPAMISVVVLPKLGPHQTMRLFLTGERFDAPNAHGYGLLHRVVPPVGLAVVDAEEVDAIAQGGPERHPRGQAAHPHRRARCPRTRRSRSLEKKIAALFASEEAAEGMPAFAEKRPPKGGGG